MDRYEKKLAGVERTIKRATPNGTNATWYQPVKSSDPDTPWDETFSTPESFPCRMVFVESRDREKEFFFKEMLRDTDIAKFKTFGIFYPQGFVPIENRDYMTNKAGESFTCDFMRKYAPEDITLLFIVGLN